MHPAEFWENPAEFSRMLLEAACGGVLHCFCNLLGTPAKFWDESCRVFGGILRSVGGNPAEFRQNGPRSCVLSCSTMLTQCSQDPCEVLG